MAVSQRKRKLHAAMERASKVELFLNMDDTITDAKGHHVSLDDAKAFWVQGRVMNCNLSFERLARHFAFDVPALRQMYAEMDAEMRG